MLLEEVQKIDVSAGDVIIEQGDRGDYYYIVEQGTCEVSRRSAADGCSRVLAQLGPGNAFGEEEMVSGTSRNATVSMLTDGELLRLARDRFIDIVPDPLIDKVPYRMAARMHNEGAVWVDVRGPEEFSAGSLPNAIICRWKACVKNSTGWRPMPVTSSAQIPLGPAAVGTLLLAQMGFDTVCMTDSVEQVLAGDETANNNSDGTHSQRSVAGQPNSGESIVELAQRKEADLAKEIESSEPIPRDLYDDTYVGKSLADLIDQMHTRHRELTKDNASPSADDEPQATVIDLESFEAEVEQGLPAHDEEMSKTAPVREVKIATAHRADADTDELTQILGEFERGLRTYLERAKLTGTNTAPITLIVRRRFANNTTS